jgi:hypothetical protein
MRNLRALPTEMPAAASDGIGKDLSADDLHALNRAAAPTAERALPGRGLRCGGCDGVAVLDGPQMTGGLDPRSADDPLLIQVLVSGFPARRLARVTSPMTDYKALCAELVAAIDASVAI